MKCSREDKGLIIAGLEQQGAGDEVGGEELWGVLLETL